jgi:DNA-binding beta-propeller fold protein YncE
MNFKRITAVTFVIAAVALTVAGVKAYRWSVKHVEYYMGATEGASAPTINCILCHVDAKGGTISDRLLKPAYLTPQYISTCKKGRFFYITAESADALLVVDAADRKKILEIPVGRRPHSIAVNPDCSIAYVSNFYSDTVSVVDLKKAKTVSSFSAGMAPAGLALSPEGDRLFVASWMHNDIRILDAHDGSELIHLAGGNKPNRMTLSPDGKQILVTNQLARVSHFPEIPASEVTAIDVSSGRVLIRYRINNAHILEGAAFTPESDLALVLLTRPKNLLPAVQVERGWMATYGFAVIDFQTGNTLQFPLDDVDSFYADPSDIVVTPDGRHAFISHGGVDTVSVIDMSKLRELVRSASDKEQADFANNLGLSSKYVIRRIHTGINPRGLAVSPEGQFVYVAESLDDTIGIIDVKRLEITGHIDLGGSKHISVLRRGERLFHSADITFQRQLSCLSCHPYKSVDGLQFDIEPDGLGLNIVDNRTLLGIRETAPFKWKGSNTSLYMQCGIRFARWFTRSSPYSVEDLNALVAYINSLEPLPDKYREAKMSLTPAQNRGREIFERTSAKDGKPIPETNQCLTCHPAPYYTDRKVNNVGTKSQWDTLEAFDTPQLTDVSYTAPYLHDGKAKTLEEIWTVFSPNDTHGVVSDIGKNGLNDLIEYLKTL